MTDHRYLTVSEIADELRVQPRTVRLWITSGRLPAIQAGRQWRITRQDLEAFLSRHTQDGEKTSGTSRT